MNVADALYFGAAAATAGAIVAAVAALVAACVQGGRADERIEAAREAGAAAAGRAAAKGHAALASMAWARTPATAEPVARVSCEVRMAFPREQWDRLTDDERDSIVRAAVASSLRSSVPWRYAPDAKAATTKD